MSADMSFLHLVLNAGLVVQMVMLLLLFVSLISWGMILGKRSVLKAANHSASRFEKRFWSGKKNMKEMYASISNARLPRTGMELIFESGYREFVRLRQNAGIEPDVVLDGVQRAMRVELNRETERLETHLSFLATVGSTSPYVGLFGTVWGIMNSFHALGQVQQATIAMVAPGISEALIATAMGLFAAIPAVIAYNRFSNDVERLLGRYDIFQEEFFALLHHHHHSS